MGHKKSKDLTERMFLNTITSAFNYVAIVLVTFIVSPLLLSYLGTTLFGTWQFCQRLLSYVRAIDGRAPQALKWTIAHKQASNDFGAKRRDVGSAVVVWFIFLPLLVFAGCVISWFSPYLINELPREHFLIVRLTCVILVLNLIILPLRSIPEAVLIGTNQAYKCIGINPLATVIQGGLMIWAAYTGWGIVGVAASLMCATMVRAAMIFWVSKRNISWLGISWPSRTEVSHFFKFSFWVFCWTFINKLMLSGDILILGLAISAAKVASYSLTQYTMLASINLAAMIVSSVIPGLGGIVGQKDFEKAAKVRGEIMVGSWLVIVVLGSVILLWNNSFLTLWVGKEYFIGFAENFMMVLMMVQLVLIRNDAFIIDVTLNIKQKVLLGACSTVVGLFLAYFMVRYCDLGVVGLVVGLMIGRGILTVLFPIMVNKAFHLKGRRQLVSLSRPFFTTSILFSITVYLGMHVTATSWLYLALYVVFSAVLVLSLAFYMGFTKEQRVQILVRLTHWSVLGRFMVRNGRS